MLARLRGLLYTLRSIWLHPLGSRRRGPALRAYFRYLFWSRLAPGPVAVDYVNGSKLMAVRGSYSCSVLWFSLPEYEDMSFLGHLLRPGDLFLDVGANGGAYAVLAGAVGADVIAFEPDPRARALMTGSVKVSELEPRVQVVPAAVGSRTGVLALAMESQAVLSHVATPQEAAGTGALEVPVTTLDAHLAGRAATAMKIDVEGFEKEVLDGAEQLLRSPTLLAVVAEFTGLSERYGVTPDSLHERMVALGYAPFGYHAYNRTVHKLAGRYTDWWRNTIYVKTSALADVEARVRAGAALAINGLKI